MKSRDQLFAEARATLRALVPANQSIEPHSTSWQETPLWRRAEVILGSYRAEAVSAL